MTNSELVEKQREYFKSGQTREIAFRLEQLKKLKTIIKLYQKELYDSFMQDLNKCEYDVIMTEMSIVKNELKNMIKNLTKYARPKKVKTSIINAFTKGKIIKEPYGVCLIVSPWNYPFQLAFVPLIGAIAAGNTAILKPSSSTPNISETMKKMLSAFDEKYVACLTGSREELADLFEQKFDYAFFTGGKEAGTSLLGKLSKNLTPCVLELGGKSPCIVDFDADLELAAKRGVWGKFLNAGQTCVAPDYFLVHETVKDKFIELVKKEIEERYYVGGILNQNFVSMVNEKQRDRVKELIDYNKVVAGGKIDGLTIEPTVMDNVTRDDKIMQQEIFGPVMPIVHFTALNEELEKLKSLDRPLALYYFSTDKTKQNYVINNAIFGGGCINDTLVHLTEEGLPFGGVGASGMGSYHGEKTFYTFSHEKSVLINNSKFNLPLKTMPYTRKKLKLMRWYFK